MRHVCVFVPLSSLEQEKEMQFETRECLEIETRVCLRSAQREFPFEFPLEFPTEIQRKQRETLVSRL